MITICMVLRKIAKCQGAGGAEERLQASKIPQACHVEMPSCGNAELRCDSSEFGCGGHVRGLPHRRMEAINDWIRNSQAFDGVTDFDAALRDPDDPERLHPVFDSGDHGHLNDAGYAVMAFEAESELINLRGGPW